jgi:hypothetical protein
MRFHRAGDRARIVAATLSFSAVFAIYRGFPDAR